MLRPFGFGCSSAAHERSAIARENGLPRLNGDSNARYRYVTKSKDGKSCKGQIKTLSVRASIDILPNTAKTADTQPDFRVFSQSVEIGAGWVKTAESSGKDYVSLSLVDPVFGGRKLFANLGQAAGQDDENVFAVIWNPPD